MVTGWFQGAPPSAPATATAAGTSELESRTLAEFSRHYGIQFQRPELLKLALTHRSYLSVTGQGPRESNERLEFLGDSVLGLVTSEFLYRQHPTEHEGQLTKTKSLLVSKAILSRRALAMGLGRFVLMSHSEIESGGRQRLSILADAFEAVVGAIYLDQGFEAARAFISRWLLADTREIMADKRHTNFKSHLQEYVQSTYRTHPVYRIRSEMGPDHSKQFNVDVLVGKRTLGSGRGPNKKEAEQAAARNALEAVEAPKSERPLRERRPAATAPAASPALHPDDGVGASDDDDGEPRRKRRGRRGGRGREHERGTEPRSAAPAASAPTPGLPRPTPGLPTVVTPRAVAPATRPTTPAEPRTAAPVNRVPGATASPAEPSVPEPEIHEEFYERFDEEDFDEVGRPEGPLEERHVDPYDFDVPAPGPKREEPVDEPEVAASRMERPEPTRLQSRSRETRAPFPEPTRTTSEPSSEPAATSDAEKSQESDRKFGRRSGRGRR
jgi:ribonuclease-3